MEYLSTSRCSRKLMFILTTRRPHSPVARWRTGTDLEVCLLSKVWEPVHWRRAWVPFITPKRIQPLRYLLKITKQREQANQTAGTVAQRDQLTFWITLPIRFTPAYQGHCPGDLGLSWRKSKKQEDLEIVLTATKQASKLLRSRVRS